MSVRPPYPLRPPVLGPRSSIPGVSPSVPGLSHRRTGVLRLRNGRLGGAAVLAIGALGLVGCASSDPPPQATPVPSAAAEDRAPSVPETRTGTRRPAPTASSGRPGRESRLHASDDPVARLDRELAAGAEPLQWDSAHGYLPALLDRLGIPVTSQTLVFSRTSLQTDRIAPWTPRALYFNDDVYVGWVQESPILEIAAVDPKTGGVFYTVDQTDPQTPRFRRESTTCLMCHESRTVTGGVPGFMVLSVLADRHGYVITEVADGPVSDRTPVHERWGGWYVTGVDAETPHAGNAMAPVLSTEVSDDERYLSEFAFGRAEDRAPLAERFDVTPYLGEGSDAVAIAVLTHQSRIHNLITQAQTETARALDDQNATIRTRGGEVPEDGYMPLTRLRIESATERLVQGMLFVGEAPWDVVLSEPSRFAAEFEARGPHDPRGRSLRDFDLEERLFRYPLSFLIYSEAFAALPDVVREIAYRRIREILAGEDTDGAFAHLEPPLRSAIEEILTATLPEYGDVRP